MGWGGTIIFPHLKILPVLRVLVQPPFFSVFGQTGMECNAPVSPQRTSDGDASGGVVEDELPPIVLVHISPSKVRRRYHTPGDEDARGDHADLEVLEDPLAVELDEEVGDARLSPPRIVPLLIPRECKSGDLDLPTPPLRPRCRIDFHSTD